MFGSHLSIAGGMVNALTEARRLKLDTVQVFTKNQQQWKVRPIDPAAKEAWLCDLNALGWTDRVVSHASYLINLASPDDELWEKSVALMRVEIERCLELSIRYLVHHPGAYTTSTEKRGLQRIARAYKQLASTYKGEPIVVCLEDTVGSGSNLGRTFDQLATLRSMILEKTALPESVGYCFDTCHAHAGGYDMSTRAGAAAVLDEFDALCGISNLKVLHLNDSMGDCGSRRDRHAHIGEGTIAPRSLKDSGFAAVVNHPALRNIPKILETPKGENDKGVPYDTANLKRLKRLIDKSQGGSVARSS